MEKTKVDGKEVKLGDWVHFKSDIEQCGEIIEIHNGLLTLWNGDGFEGEHIEMDRSHIVKAKDCWLED